MRASSSVSFLNPFNHVRGVSGSPFAETVTENVRPVVGDSREMMRSGDGESSMTDQPSLRSAAAMAC